MPKIRCRSCEAVLNLPEKALGKTIACPKCKAKFKVPAQLKSKDTAAAKTKRKKTAPQSNDDDPFGFGNLDDVAMEDREDQICPYCAADLIEGDPVCRSCGMNVETGQMDRREKKKRERKGPDPTKFYKAAWVDSGKFLKKEFGLAIRTGSAWTLFTVLTMLCGYMGFVYVQEQMPPKVFWITMTVLMFLGIPGWYWVLGLQIVGDTRVRAKFQSDRIHFDFFSAIASGVRALAWPLIMMGPIMPVLALVWFGMGITDPKDPVFASIAGFFVFGLPLLTLPLGMVHMTARYRYKGWIFWELLQDLFRNLPGVIYYHIISLIVILPVLLVAVPIYWMIKDVNPFHSTVVNDITGKITMWCLDTAGIYADEESILYTLGKVFLNIGAAFLLVAPIGYVAAFPAVFLMRATGVFGYYFSESIATVDRIRSGTPATFWVRYLSHVIDTLLSVLSCFIVTTSKRASKVAWACVGFLVLIALFSRQMLPIAAPLFLLFSHWMYFVIQESSQLRSTMGKDAFGLTVVTEDDKKLSTKDANIKWLLRLIFDLTGGIAYLLAAFHPQKKALHDLMTKTKVVWKGDR